MLPPLLRLLFPSPHPIFNFSHPERLLPPPEGQVNLYVHLPFCRAICPFCPYVKQVYDAATADSYEDALLRELQLYEEAWGATTLGSVYFGGGTPSLTPGIVESVLGWLARNWGRCEQVGVEIHPLDTGRDLLQRLRESGVTMASLGIQTFSDRLLTLLARGYSRVQARSACERVMAAGFDSVDLDLIFALPGQTVRESQDDFAIATATGSDQISAYPLIEFSDTALPSHLASRGVRLPSRVSEKHMLDALVKQARLAGYERSSIWSFNRPGSRRYTTVTRESVLGIGAGASSRIGDRFQVNTFLVSDYIQATREGSPAALGTHLNEGDRIAYWLFWRFYDTVIDTGRFREMFRREMPLTLRAALAALCALGLAHQEGTVLRLTDRGSYLFHLIEQDYTHSYLEKLWSTCRREAWPRAVRL